MVGMGELYLPAFVAALALGEVATGLVGAVPPAAGAVLQLVSPWAVRRLGSHKRWVVWCVGVQTATFVPLFVGAVLGVMPAWLVFLLATTYFCGGLAAGAAWSTWIATLIPGPDRPRFFSTRSRVQQVTQLAGFMLGGTILSVAAAGKAAGEGGGGGGGDGGVLLGFAALFLMAGMARGVSLWYLLKQDEPTPLPRGHRSVPLGSVLRAAGRRSDTRLILYMLSVMAAANVVAPFLNPYMLQHLGLRSAPLAYASLVGAVMLGKAAALLALGRLAGRIGAERLLAAGGVLITPIAALWTVSERYDYLLALQLASGVAWACWELASFLLLLEHVREEERTSMLSWYFLGNFAALAGGSLAGGWVLGFFKTGAGTYDATGYAWLMWASSLLRAATLVLLWRFMQVTARSRAVGVDASVKAAAQDAAWADGKKGE